MAKYKIRSTGKTVDLTDDMFKAKGGEGSIYVLDNMVYKICEPGKMIPEAKFQELSVLDHPNIIRPLDILLEGKTPVGYTMRLVPNNARPLIETLTKAYREREGVTPKHEMNLVQKMADGIRFIHKHNGYLQVDGNESNYMISEKHDEVHFIDVNSFQTPNFPATAIMASIRDWHVAKDPATNMYIWTQLSDWYSFAIISFYMFTAIHPFKGRHPAFTNMKTLMYDQMLHCKSVLDPETQYPLGAVYPFEDVIPGGKDGAFMKWYKAVFVDNRRLPAPKDYQSTIALVAKIREIIGSDKFNINEVYNYVDAIVGYYEQSGSEVVVTKSSIYINKTKSDRPAERFRVGFTKNNQPYACWLENEQVRLQNLQNKQMIQATINGTDIMSCEGRVYVQSEQNIFEIEFFEQNSILATSKMVASIMPNATRMFQGVAVQNMLGSLIFSIFPKSGHHRPIRIKELEKYKIVDAKYERNVLMVLVVDDGKYSRYIFRFSEDWQSYDVRIVEDIIPTGINFTVLERGVCICITEEENVEIFSNQKDKPDIKKYDDPAIDSEMRLCHAGDSVRFAKSGRLYTFSVKK